MDSLARKKRLQRLAIVVPLVMLLGIVTFHILRLSPEEKEEQKFAELVLERTPGQMAKEAREQLREQWKSFPPESRRRIFRRVAKSRLEKARAETQNMNPEQRRARIKKTLEEMREQRSKLDPAERTRIRQRLESPEGKEMVRHMMDFYREELTARERAEMDPLMHEWLFQTQRIMGGR
ncbi:MAG: hypothetical protein KAI66_02730 [Lentisphaeria bacterium]|nr:hypothetical protein [Lentisphaeria bacterium]